MEMQRGQRYGRREDVERNEEAEKQKRGRGTVIRKAGRDKERKKN